MRKKPMLAHPVGGFERITDEEWDSGLYIQPKLDGVRCIIQAELIKIVHYDYAVLVTAYSRTGKEWKNIDHILKELKPFFAKHPNVILDGELYNHDLKKDFEKIISLVRKTKPTEEDRYEASQKVQFHCYDTIMEHMDFESRNSFIKRNISNKFNSVRTLPTIKVFDTECVEVNHENFLESGCSISSDICPDFIASAFSST